MALTGNGTGCVRLDVAASNANNTLAWTWLFVQLLKETNAAQRYSWYALTSLRIGLCPLVASFFLLKWLLHLSPCPP